VEQHHHAFAAALRGDQRRAVGERRPGAVVQARVGLRQDLAVHRHVGRHRHAEERAFPPECCKVLRLLPAQRAAERASAAAQLHRNQVFVGRGREARAGEAHQHAAVIDPSGELIACLCDIADIGQDHHRQPLFRNWPTACASALIGEPRRAKRPEGAREIIGGGRATRCAVSAGWCR
jgi:hypothetical protein